MAYITPDDVKVRYDARRLGDLVNDDDTRATSSELDSNAVLLAMIDDAECLFRAALLAGKRYTEADLTSLTSTDKNLLTRILCDLVYGFLMTRRGYSEADLIRLAPGVRVAMNFLELLRAGEYVFNLDNQIEAGTLSRVVLSRNINLVSSATRLFGDLDIQD